MTKEQMELFSAIGWVSACIAILGAWGLIALFGGTLSPITPLIVLAFGCYKIYKNSSAIGDS